MRIGLRSSSEVGIGHPLRPPWASLWVATAPHVPKWSWQFETQNWTEKRRLASQILCLRSRSWVGFMDRRALMIRAEGWQGERGGYLDPPEAHERKLTKRKTQLGFVSHGLNWTSEWLPKRVSQRWPKMDGPRVLRSWVFKYWAS
jgi:hypothetical protein